MLAQFTASIVLVAALAATALAAFLVRVFSVIKFESIIHEFDPWFNYRAAQYLLANGRRAFSDWFDTDSWYPLGRLVGHSVFPGLMYTTLVGERLLRALRLPLDIRHVCVFTAPLFSVVSVLGTYFMTVEICGKRTAGLFSALFIAVTPSYLSRSVAGSFDNEAISITLLLLTLLFFLKAMRMGSVLWGFVCGLTFAYLVAAWGGYHFIALFVPTFVLGIVVVQRFDERLYIAYSVYYTVGSLWAVQTRNIGVSALSTGEHLPSHAAFLAIQAIMAWRYICARLTPAQQRFLVRRGVALGAVCGTLGVALLVARGKLHFSPRVMSLLDPSYAARNAPIIASVSEHQPTPWATFFFDLHFLLVLAPMGLHYVLRRPTLPGLFIALYAVSCVYLAGLMVRLLLVLAPAVCVLAGIGAAKLLRRATRAARSRSHPRIALAAALTLGVTLLTLRYLVHSTVVGAEVYSSPTVVISRRNYSTGEKNIIDDFREAYYWLRQNSVPRSKVMSWWDYGYQIAGFSDRTTICDNNTWNYTHIAVVGKVLASDEETAYQLMDDLGVDYVLVTFGGKSGYGGDDINKFLWIIRITANEFPSVRESDFLNPNYRVDAKITPAMRNSVMYKLNYYRFWEEDLGRGHGFDIARQVHIGHTHFKLKYFEEVFTSERWLVRIYRRKSRTNRQEVGFVPADWQAYPASLGASSLAVGERSP